MSIQANYHTSTSFVPGRNALVPLSSHYSDSRSQSPYIISQGGFVNKPFHQDDATVLSTNTQISEFQKEGKALGATHIMTALVHFGLGIILGLMTLPQKNVAAFSSYAVIAGYPFWGGICFLVTGVLAILGAKQNYSCLSSVLYFFPAGKFLFLSAVLSNNPFYFQKKIKGSLGMSIASAVVACVGVILLLVDFLLNKYPDDHWLLISGKGISSMLTIFSLLELSISAATAHVIIGTISQNHLLLLVTVCVALLLFLHVYYYHELTKMKDHRTK